MNERLDLQGTETQQQKKRAFLAALQQKFSVTHAAAAAGVGRRTLYRWRREDAAFRAAWEDCRETAIEALEASAFERAMGGDTTLTIFLLKCHRPQLYNERLAAQRAIPPELTLDDLFPEGISLQAVLDDAWWDRLLARLRSFELGAALPLLVDLLKAALQSRREHALIQRVGVLAAAEERPAAG